MNRRRLLSGLIAITAAPAIVRSESLMRIWVPPAPAILAPGSGMLLMMNGHGTGATWAHSPFVEPHIKRYYEWLQEYINAEPLTLFKG